MNKKILVLCPHPENVAPGQRLKYEQYFEHFRENDIDIDVSSFMTMAFWNIVYKKGFFLQKVYWTCLGYLKRFRDLFRLGKYDCVYVFLWGTPFGSTIFERLIRILSKKIIYDIDDLVFLKPKSKANPIARLFKSSEKAVYLMKTSDHVITCTPYLDQFVRKYNQNTTDISSTINTSTYKPINKYVNSEVLTLGWSGSFSTSKYLQLLEAPLRNLKKKYDFKILVIGDSRFELEGLIVEAIEWSEPNEVQNLQRFDIGLYPLPNEEWVFGKSGLKALQYMALGIPTVATKIGASERVIENEVSGFLVNTEQEWEERLEELIKSAKLRQEIGEKARVRVENIYSIAVNKKTYLDVLQKVMSN